MPPIFACCGWTLKQKLSRPHFVPTATLHNPSLRRLCSSDGRNFKQTYSLDETDASGYLPDFFFVANLENPDFPFLFFEIPARTGHFFGGNFGRGRSRPRPAPPHPTPPPPPHPPHPPKRNQSQGSSGPRATQCVYRNQPFQNRRLRVIGPIKPQRAPILKRLIAPYPTPPPHPTPPTPPHPTPYYSIA